MYLVAFAISAATLVDTWELHRPWLRPVAIAAVIATVVSLRWRRSHPGAVGIFVAAVSVVLITTPFVAAFNAAIRAHGRDLAVVAGLTIVSCFTNPMLYRGSQSLALEFGAGLGLAGAAIGWGLFVRARRELVWSMREQSDRAAEGRARPSGDGSRGRCTTCSPTASRCSPSTPARSSSTPMLLPRRSPKRPA